MPISKSQRKFEKKIVSLVVNPQFSKLIRELLLDLEVHHHIANFFGDLEDWRSDILCVGLLKDAAIHIH